MYEIRKNGFEGSAGHFYDLCRCQSLDHRQAGIPGAGSVVVSAESGIPGFRGIGLGRRRDFARGLDTDQARLIRLFFQPVLIAWALWSTDGVQKLKEWRKNPKKAESP